MVSRPRFARRRRYARRIPRNYLTRDQTITMTLETPNQEQEYFPVDASHLDQLYSRPTTSAGSNEALSIVLASCVGFKEYASMFRWMRVSRIKVKLIPETWNATTTVGNADPNLTDGEKPTIHWINDDGAVGTLTSGVGISIPVADSYGKAVKKERLFTKPMTFNIKPYYRTSGFSGSITDPKYISSNQWRGINPVDLNAYGLVIPEKNLYYGFTNVPVGFQYKTVIEMTVTFKQPYVIPAP